MNCCVYMHLLDLPCSDLRGRDVVLVSRACYQTPIDYELYSTLQLISWCTVIILAGGIGE